MSEALRILVVEDNPADADFIRETLPETGPVSFQIESVARLAEARTRLESKGIDLVLLDLGLPDSHGLETFHVLRKAAPEVPVIVLTGTDDQELAFAAVRDGAQDYFVKGQVSGSLLVRAARYALERQKAEAALRESEARFRIAQDMSPDGFTILRPVRDAQERVVDFTWVYENPTIARLNGTEPAAVVGRRLLELFPGHRGTPFLRAYQQVAESGKTCIFEADYSGESMSKPTWFRIVVVPMTRDIAILAQDITERKRVEGTLTEQLDELRRWQEAMEGREGRVLKVKKEVNELLRQAGQPIRYPSAVEGGAEVGGQRTEDSEPLNP